MGDREDTAAQAGALERRVHDVYDRNDSLQAENDSLRVGFEAVSQENVALRETLEKRTRQRDAIARKLDLYEANLRQMTAIGNETIRATEGARQENQMLEGRPPIPFAKRPAG
jgi:hypothetical protein